MSHHLDTTLAEQNGQLFIDPFRRADFEALTYRVSFDEAESQGRQVMRLHTIAGKKARENSAAGELVLERGTVEPSSAGGPPSYGHRSK